MKKLRHKLSYANVVATVALFLALGGASYAAVSLPGNSVGTKQLKKEAVTNGKIAAGAVTWDKMNPASMGTVPSAAVAKEATHATQADRAAQADNAALATESEFAYEAEDSEFLGGEPAAAYGAILTAHTEIPATNVDAEWFVPVSGLGEPRPAIKEVEMLTPSTGPLYAAGFTAFSWTGPSSEDDAEVTVQLYNFGEPVGMELEVHRLGYEYWPWLPGQGVEIPAGGRLAIKVTEETNGEEIPALSLNTSLMLSPGRL